ncbi:MAG TPA: hypothetical protein VHZ49_06080 [Methylomirabilota bacterium]|nr:hypothetical protein [Methylomirabilota bacterium]
MRHAVHLVGVVVVLLTLAMPRAVRAEDVETLRRQLDTMQRELEAATKRYERQIQELGERLRQLESRPAPPSVAAPPAPAAPATATPPTAATVATPAGTSPAAGADTPSLAQILTPRQPFALAQPGRTLLFDIGVSGDFVADFTSAERERHRDGTFAGRENRLFPREVSVGFFGRVDPYASAVVRITAGEETPPPGERSRGDFEVAVEEANVTLLALPLGTTARLGRMRPRFGTLNPVHQDDLPQVDRPQVLTRFFGEEQLDAEDGIDAFWILPLPVYEEISIGVFNGDNETAFGRGTLRDPLVLGRLRTFFEGEDWGGLQIDLSAGTGATDDARRNTVAGVGVKYKWAPLTGFPLMTLAGEAIYGHRAADRWGYYVYAQYDWTRRWAAGLRWDWTEVPRLNGYEWAISPYVQFKPSEFLRFRVQYKHTEGTRDLARAIDELFLQGSFILGAHPTERF